MKYKQLTLDQRYHIYGLYLSGYKQVEIGNELGVHKSTISRELKRNSSWRGYYPKYAQYETDLRRIKAYKRCTFTQALQEFVIEKLLLDWSPEQISGYCKKYKNIIVSHERIYKFIKQDKLSGGSLYLHLRYGHKQYRKKYGSAYNKNSIKNRIIIDERPQIVDDKSRIGDWEIDTIIGGNQKQAVVTIVERVSKKILIKKVVNKTSHLVSNATIKLLHPILDQVHTITSDNGTEFANHEFISKSLKADFYFAHPYSSWERGLNENSNGLIRQYLRKGSEFHNVTDKDLDIIMEKLNNRPRKTLGYATPNEVFNNKTLKRRVA